MRPCLVCKNTKYGQLSKHHLIPREVIKDLGINIQSLGRVRTIKLCKDKRGCQSHHLFHIGDLRTAKKIRRELDQSDIQWMVEIIGSNWVKKTYPPK